MRTAPSRSIHRLIGTAALLLTAGCAPVIDSVRYLSLEGYADARVIERARPDLHSRHFFVDETPTRYEVARDGYTLDIETHFGFFVPRVDVGVRPYPEYRIGFRDETGRNPSPCVGWIPSKTRPDAWFRVDVCDERALDAIDRELRFSVFDRHGNVVADEVIPFTIKRNGLAVTIDAI